MTSRIFFDTNVLVYALGDPRVDLADPRPARAEELLEQGGVVSVQVLNEYADAASRKLKLSWPKIADSLRLVEMLCGRARAINSETQLTALAFSDRYGFRIFDSMILASALEAGCSTVYSEDLQHGQIIEGLRIENPFRSNWPAPDR
jgi:predicted nucleic acid-binding protein